MADDPHRGPFEGGDAVFRRHGELLLSVARSMLGDADEATAVVREVRDRWAGEPGRHASGSATALVRLTTSMSIARLRATRPGGGGHLGPWLPEPLIDEPDMDVAAALSAAMAVILDALRPAERTVFVLRHGFGLSDADIAAVTGRAVDGVPATGRGGAAWAGRAAHPVDDDLAMRFVAFCTAQDRPNLCGMLARDVVLKSGGQRAPGVTGRDLVADALLAWFADEPACEWSPALDADGLVLVWTEDPSAIGAVLLRTSDGTVAEIDLIDRRLD